MEPEDMQAETIAGAQQEILAGARAAGFTAEAGPTPDLVLVDLWKPGQDNPGPVRVTVRLNPLGVFSWDFRIEFPGGGIQTPFSAGSSIAGEVITTLLVCGSPTATSAPLDPPTAFREITGTPWPSPE